MTIQNKNVFITGSTRGIGLAIAHQFASLGANVVLNGRSQVAPEILESFQAYPGQAIAITGDISQAEEAKRMVDEAIERLGSVDILVNNAGITNDKLVLKMTEEDFESVLKVNLTGAFNMTQSVLKPMTRARQGVIINISSVVGLTGNVGQANYAASKAGLIGFTKSVAREVAARGIRVNAIAPGFIASDMTDVIPEKMQKAIVANIPMKRIGKAEEVATVTLVSTLNFSTWLSIFVRRGLPNSFLIANISLRKTLANSWSFVKINWNSSICWFNFFCSSLSSVTSVFVNR